MPVQLQYVGRLSVFGEDEALGLGVAEGGDGASTVEGQISETGGRGGSLRRHPERRVVQSGRIPQEGARDDPRHVCTFLREARCLCY